jgi:hypothetical protein
MTDVIERYTALAEDIDPMGRKWGVTLDNMTHLYFIGLVKEDKSEEDTEKRFKVSKNNVTIPSTSKAYGEFTSQTLAREALKYHLNELWDYNDAEKAKLERKATVAKQKAAEPEVDLAVASEEEVIYDNVQKPESAKMDDFDPEMGGWVTE